MRTVIRRCPISPAIQSRAEEIAFVLDYEMDIVPRITNGACNELSIIVDDVPVVMRVGEPLPRVDEVMAAMEWAAPDLLGPDGRGDDGDKGILRRTPKPQPAARAATE